MLWSHFIFPCLQKVNTVTLSDKRKRASTANMSFIAKSAGFEPGTWYLTKIAREHARLPVSFLSS